MARNRWPLHTQNDEGAAAVEFALVSMVLVMLLVGIVQFGFIFNQWQQIEHAAREGARRASLGNSSADVVATVQAAAPGVGLTAADIVLNPADPTSNAPGSPMTVTVSTNVTIFTPLMAQFLGGGGSVPLSAQATQRME